MLFGLPIIKNTLKNFHEKINWEKWLEFSSVFIFLNSLVFLFVRFSESFFPEEPLKLVVFPILILGTIACHTVNFAVAFDWLRKDRWTSSFYNISIILILEAIYGIFYWGLSNQFLKLKNENILQIFCVSAYTLISLPLSIQISWNRLALINRTIFGDGHGFAKQFDTKYLEICFILYLICYVSVVLISPITSWLYPDAIGAVKYDLIYVTFPIIMFKEERALKHLEYQKINHTNADDDATQRLPASNTSAKLESDFRCQSAQQTGFLTGSGATESLAEWFPLIFRLFLFNTLAICLVWNHALFFSDSPMASALFFIFLLGIIFGHLMNCALAFDWERKNRWTASFYNIAIFLISETSLGVFYWGLSNEFSKFKNDGNLRIICALFALPLFIQISWNRLSLINRTIFGKEYWFTKRFNTKHLQIGLFLYVIYLIYFWIVEIMTSRLDSGPHRATISAYESYFILMPFLCLIFTVPE